MPATEEDWSTEYSDLILSVKIVAGCGRGHPRTSIATARATPKRSSRKIPLAAARFMTEVDAAGVFQNASTRFADGYRYGFGAELGISNSKLHARGPMGLEGLTTYKFKLFGNGHTVAEYVKGEKKFTHRPLS